MNKCSTFILWNILSNNKEKQTDIDNKMDESQKMLSEKVQRQKNTFYMIPFILSSRRGQICRDGYQKVISF